jgi:sigma-B regulation protein RsbU (phosphoserine phosphatase)
VLAVAFLVSRAITLPIIRLADAAAGIAEGDLDARVPEPNRGDELGRMARAFNNMVPKLRDRLRIRDSLHLAMQVQQSLLPTAPPKLPGLDIAGESIYCDETGGDYYDFIEHDADERGRLGVAIGDVAGHGVAAALLMATVRALLRSRADIPGSLAELFGDVNRQLCASDFSGRFMTLFFLLIDVRDRSFRYISAGHDPAILYRPSTDEFIEYAGHDIPLGVEDDWTFREIAAEPCRPGDVMVLGTDGIWECMDEQDRMFGKLRLREVVRAAATGSAQHISAAVRESLFAFRGACEQRDDITLVVIKFTDDN